MAERELWYDNGQPRTTEYYDPGNVKNGTFKAWFKNGQLRKQNVFKHGVPVSEKSWTMEGNPVIEKTYQQGKLNGKTKRWDDRTGQLIEEKQYKLGKLNGLQREWDTDTGKLIKEVTYKNGIPSSARKQYDGKTGELNVVEYLDHHGKLLKHLVDGEASEKRYNHDKVTSERCGYNTPLYDPDEKRRKAQNGDGYAQFKLGQFYQGCTAVEQTMKWYKKAAHNNNLQAINKLITIYQSGDGMFASVKDRKKGWPYKEQAAKLGSVDYQLDVGFEYLPTDFANYLFDDWKQDGYVSPNPTKSLGLFEKSGATRQYTGYLCFWNDVSIWNRYYRFTRKSKRVLFAAAKDNAKAFCSTY